jgi:hypothetical protein
MLIFLSNTCNRIDNKLKFLSTISTRLSNVRTVGAVFRVAAIIRVAAVFGALKIIFSELFFLHDNFQVRKNQNQKKNFEFFFFCVPVFLAQSQNRRFS